MSRVTHSSSSSFMVGEQRLLRSLENAPRLLPRHRRELVEKLVERFAVLQTVEEVLDGDAGAEEDGGAAEFFGIAFNQLRLHLAPQAKGFGHMITERRRKLP